MKINQIIISIFVSAVLILSSCTKEAVVACFSTTKTTFETNENVAFTNCTNGDAKYLWLFGDGTSSEEFNPTHKYSKAGIYNVTLSVITSSTTVPLVYSNTIRIQSSAENFSKVTNKNFDITRTVTTNNTFSGFDSTYSIMVKDDIVRVIRVLEDQPGKIDIKLSDPFDWFKNNGYFYGMSIVNNEIIFPDQTETRSNNLGGAAGFQNIEEKTTNTSLKYSNGMVTFKFKYSYKKSYTNPKSGKSYSQTVDGVAIVYI